MSKRKYPETWYEGNDKRKKRRQAPNIDLKQPGKRKELQWLKGRLCPIINKKYYIKPNIELPDGYAKTKDVLMHPNHIPQFVLPLTEGDELKFVLGDRDKMRPMARKVLVSQYTARNYKDLTEYIRKITKDLEGVNVKQILTDVLPCSALWRFLGSPLIKNSTDEKFPCVSYVQRLLNLFKLILHHGKPLKILLQDAIKNFIQGVIFQNTNDQSLPVLIESCEYDNNDKFYSEEEKMFLSAELVRSFCHDVICLVPSDIHYLLPTITAISKKNANILTQDFLCTLLSINCASKKRFSVNAGMWKELPLIPTDHEMAGNLVEKDKQLSPVRTRIPYDDPEQYMDTYFRLIRAETFSEMQHGIKNLMASTLDLRDMNVYYNIHLAGFQLQNDMLSLAIHFTPLKKVKRWEASSQLMYGNLVCVSINRRFDDVIWATVSKRDEELLKKKQVIVLELLDENVKSISEIVNSLQVQGGSGIMVESPNHYRPLGAILRTLKKFDMENFPLQKEIIYAESGGELPGYLKNATFDTSIICFSQKTIVKKQSQGNKGNICGNLSTRSEGKNIEQIKVNNSVTSIEAMSTNDCLKVLTCNEEINTKCSLVKKVVKDASEESTNITRQSSVKGATLNRELVEPMDTDSMPENSLSGKSLSKAEPCIAIKSAETSSKDEDIKGRMNVQPFLKTFNSSSESRLEASQCDALIHTLKNKLAIIQGPPGCGKTFIGVKIVQLLLSLLPKLDKPILLLTYKNHALDEFLKHMLGFCDKDDVVRIGGRSKEPDLEECNLKNVQNFIRYQKATITEIENTKDEIVKIESKVNEISKRVEHSSCLTKTSLLDELSEEQIRSLILEANCPVSRRYKQSLLDDVSKQYDSVKDFLQLAVQIEVSLRHPADRDCIELFYSAVKHWFPDRRELQKMKEFQTEFIMQIQSDKTNGEDERKESEECNDDNDSGDEDYVNQVHETRMATEGRHEFALHDLIIFDRSGTKDGQEILISISDFPPDIPVSSQIRSVNNLWSLNDVQRLQFLYCILDAKTASISQELNDLIKKLQILKNRKEELEMTGKVKFLTQKKIIGVTISGASIHHDLIHRIGPNVVIVEEAAEILEPSLLAALTPSIEHLILIGDHQQLRPQVDTYELCKRFHFHISMMERLIKSGFPFKSLAKQNRMRPEFSALLKDIYPHLQDNLEQVLKNEPLKCFGKSMFFWSHTDPEKKDRTYSNVKEAERVIALVKYLLYNGVHPSDITVLAAYQGQTKLLRDMIKKEIDNTTRRFKEDFIKVQTIDNYQGDENKYIIISLVRSNEENSIGFLREMNRRCVAQSRAKCGMYFVGNRNTLCGAKASCWSKFISSMSNKGCVGDKFPLRCTKHKISEYDAKDSHDIKRISDTPSLLCTEPCGVLYPFCGKHLCKEPCNPRHHHSFCPEIVDDQFEDCGHYVKRKCSQELRSLCCDHIVSVYLPCDHKAKKKCSQNILDVLCSEMVTVTFPHCGHEKKKKCHVNIETVTCRQRCKKMNWCGNHQCKEVCGESHEHFCLESIDYNFPDCGHPSPKKKGCSQEINWNCRYKVTFTGLCGHEIQKECHQNETEVKCLVKPCGRERKCGHPCENVCGEDCDKGECKHCLRVYREKLYEFRKAAKKRVRELEEKIAKIEIPSFSCVEIHELGAFAAEYQKAKDQVLKFTQPCHLWFPKITKIEKVTNLKLEKRFEVAKSKAFGDHIDIKFHGTSNNNLKKIIKDGFKIQGKKPPTSKRGMFGQGIYFTSDSSNSAQNIYTQGSQKLLLCQIILGRSKEVYKADYSLNKRKLQSERFDSVYARRGSTVKNDEFVIFDPDQALPQYIIHFSNADVPPSPSTLEIQEAFVVKRMTPLRTVDIKDPFQMYYSWADSHFRRMAASSKPPLSKEKANISSIDIVINKDLEEKFEATRKKFQNQSISDQEILAYHGTDKRNIDSILKHNLQLSYAKRQVYGKGNYFSEFPSISLGYGDGLLLCRILPGKEFVDASSSNIPEGFNSKKVLLNAQHTHFSGATATKTSSSSTDVSGEMIIIENSDQILPFFVIHR